MDYMDIDIGIAPHPVYNSSKMVLYLKTYSKKTTRNEPQNGLHKRLPWSICSCKVYRLRLLTHLHLDVSPGP